MIRGRNAALLFKAFFTKDDGAGQRIGATGLTVTVDCYRWTEAGVLTQVVTAANATELGGGLYGYIMSGTYNDAYGSYLAVFHTTDLTVDVKDVPADWEIMAWPEIAASVPSAYTVASTVWHFTFPTAPSEGSAEYYVYNTWEVQNGSVGEVLWTYTETDSGSGLPVGDVDVWATTDLNGANVVVNGRTNQEGKVTFGLDAGTYYIWRQKYGRNYTNPLTLTLTASGTATLS